MATIAYIGTAKSSSNLTTYTHSVNFGDEASDRKIIVLGAGRDTDNWDISAITIGGVSATVTRADGSVGSYKEIWCAIADVPTGTSGNVVVTYTGQMSDNFVLVYRATGIVSNTATDYLSAGGDPATGTLDVIRGGVVVGLEISNMYRTGAATWTGLTEDVDISDGAGDDYQISGASLIPTETSIDLTVTCDITTGSCQTLVVSFPAYSPFTNPGNAYSSNDSYATCAATSGDLTIDISKDGGETYGTALTKTFTGVEGSQTYGTGSTELWGLTLTRADMVDANFRLRVTHGTYSQVYKTFGFVTGTDTLTGVEVSVEAKYASSTISIDHIKVKIYYGTSILPIQAGSMAFASNGRKNGEGAGAGTGVLVYHDGTAWRATDTGATVAA